MNKTALTDVHFKPETFWVPYTILALMILSVLIVSFSRYHKRLKKKRMWYREYTENNLNIKRPRIHGIMCNSNDMTLTDLASSMMHPDLFRLYGDLPNKSLSGFVRYNMELNQTTEHHGHSVADVKRIVIDDLKEQNNSNSLGLDVSMKVLYPTEVSHSNVPEKSVLLDIDFDEICESCKQGIIRHFERPFLPQTFHKPRISFDQRTLQILPYQKTIAISGENMNYLSASTERIKKRYDEGVDRSRRHEKDVEYLFTDIIRHQSFRSFQTAHLSCLQYPDYSLEKETSTSLEMTKLECCPLAKYNNLSFVQNHRTSKTERYPNRNDTSQKPSKSDRRMIKKGSDYASSNGHDKYENTNSKHLANRNTYLTEFSSTNAGNSESDKVNEVEPSHVKDKIIPEFRNTCSRSISRLDTHQLIIDQDYLLHQINDRSSQYDKKTLSEVSNGRKQNGDIFWLMQSNEDTLV